VGLKHSLKIIRVAFEDSARETGKEVMSGEEKIEVFLRFLRNKFSQVNLKG